MAPPSTDPLARDPKTGTEMPCALITGASSGIGRAIALALARNNFAVGLVGQNVERLYAVANAAGTTAHPLVADLSRSDAAASLVSQYRERFGRLDVLVHAAGRFALDPLDDSETEATALAAFERLMAINVRAPYVLTRHLSTDLIRTQGQVVFVNSSVVRFPNVATAYTTSKYALQGLADSIRAQLNPHHVRVLSIFPGRTATPMQETIHALEGKGYAPDRLLQPDDVASSVVHALSLPRTAELTEIHIRPMAKT